jgi:hypothetical protein
MPVPRVPKHPNESINVGVDFAARVPSGQSISSATAAVVSGADITVGSATFVGTVVTARVSGGTDGTTSSVRVQATLADGEVLAAIVDVPVAARDF